MARLAHSSFSHAAAAPACDVEGGGQRESPARWPKELLTAFSLRMSSHGMSISQIAMQRDIHYALLQLRDARGMGDATLALMADELFRHFESHSSGLLHHTH